MACLLDGKTARRSACITPLFFDGAADNASEFVKDAYAKSIAYKSGKRAEWHERGPGCCAGNALRFASRLNGRSDANVMSWAWRAPGRPMTYARRATGNRRFCS